MPKKRISVRSAKNKGMQFQKFIGEKIASLLDLPFGKDEVIRSREAGQSGTDIVLVGEAKELFNYSVECKRAESWSIHQWIKQAKDNSTEESPWLLFAKRNHEDTVVIMDIETFFKIMEENLNWRNPE